MVYREEVFSKRFARSETDFRNRVSLVRPALFEEWIRWGGDWGRKYKPRSFKHPTETDDNNRLQRTVENTISGRTRVF